MQNYHRHTSYSNIYIADSATVNEDYAKRAVELGHKVISSVEHGWQGYYYECFELAKKYDLKFVFGAEAYWVKDRIKEYSNGINKKGEETFARDRSNHHIIVLAKNENGRQAINDALSEANITGYYFRPRLDLELILNLPPDDVFITSACIAFSGYDDVDDIILQFHKHFGRNFALEIQYHNTAKQKIWNKHLLELNEKYGIDLIVGLDSHYIHEDDAWQRDAILEAKGVEYPDEIGWYMDYPDDETVMKRFLEQGIFSREQVQKAMDKTDVLLEFDDYDDVPIFSKEIKLPTLYPDLTVEEKNKLYRKLIGTQFVEYMKNIPKEEYNRYYEGVEAEIKTYEDTGMVDYPLLDYAIVKDAVEHGGLITATGRGSAVGFMTNTLCGFSKVDRFKSAIKLYPERFISTTRILETHSLPDIDLNVGNPEIFEEAQVRILGQEHTYPMIAFGTLKKKSAFKVYAKAKGMDFQLANEISEQISNYDDAVKHADGDDKDSIDIYDYVDRAYEEYIEQSKEYWGIVSDKKKAPSAYLLYQGDIRKEIGLIKCKSESTKKEYITCVIDGAIAENYKFLKNDILKVDVVLLINKVFQRIGIEHFDVNKLLELCNGNKKVWDLYANGYTMGMNQVEQDGSKAKCMRYKPHNISELSAFVAAIRPGFKSMYKRFEDREDFSYGISALDNLVRTEELPVSFLFYQEQVMSVLHYAGFPMDECYGIIKAIAKKHPEKVLPLKSKFLDGFKKQVIEDENLSEEKAEEYSAEVWQIVNDNVNYSFNSAHAYCVALDSLYQAWQKATYPFEFYEVLLQHYSDKGNKAKVSALKQEMKAAFGIKEGAYKFRNDNRSFVSDKENKVIYPSLASIKNISQKCADSLYSLKDNTYKDFVDLLLDLKKIKITSRQSDILIKVGYFDEFGEIGELLKQREQFDEYYDKKQFKKDKLATLGIPEDIVRHFSEKETEKIFNGVNMIEFLREWFKVMPYTEATSAEKATWQYQYMGYTDIVDNSLANYVLLIDVNVKYSPRITAYSLKNGTTFMCKIQKNIFRQSPLQEGDVIYIFKGSKKQRVRAKQGGGFEKVEGEFDIWLSDYELKARIEK